MIFLFLHPKGKKQEHMKVHDKKLLVWGTIVCLLISGGITYALYQNGAKYWREQASATFRQALELELQKRDTVLVFHKESMGYSTFSLDEPSPESITVIDDLGEREYMISKKKFDHSLVKEGLKRSILSILLEDYPLIPDTLNKMWDSLLVSTDIPVKTRTRVSVTDFQERTSVAHSENISGLLSADSLLSYYLGERCEVEATGFISYGWYEAFSGWGYLAICLPWIIFAFLFFSREKIMFILEKWFIKHKIITVKTIVPVIAVKAEESHIYQLEEGVFFDTEEKVLKDARLTKKLAPQVAYLLKLFLESEGYRLSTGKIDEALWPDGSGTQDRIYTVIRRLRKSLDGITHLVVDYENDVYQLKSSAVDEIAKDSAM